LGLRALSLDATIVPLPICMPLPICVVLPICVPLSCRASL